MNQVIVGIHGLGNKPQKSILERWWKKSIIEGLTRINEPAYEIHFELVFWADILYPEQLNSSIKDEKNPLYLDEPYKFQPFTKQKIVPENRFLATIFNFFEKQLDYVFLNQDMSLKFSSLTENVIKRYFSDLEIYYSPGQTVDKRLIRDVIQERLINVLKKHKDKEIMLVAHSMGSIIAYDVLMNLTEEIGINTFVTIGSPLGLPMVVSRIFNEIKINNKKIKYLRTPDNVTHHWYNLSDKDDKVALDHTLADDYKTNQQNVSAFDINVYNDYVINNKRNPHKIYGYLRTTEMAQIISHFLTDKRKSSVITNYLSLKTWLGSQINRIKGNLKK